MDDPSSGVTAGVSSLFLNADHDDDPSLLPPGVPGGGSSSSIDDGLVLLKAAKTGSVAHVRRVLASDGVDANERDSRLFTPLMWACANGHLRCVEALVRAPKEKAVSLGARNEAGDSALHWACWRGEPSAVWLLLAAGANPAVVGDNGMLPIHYAATGAHIEAVRALLQFGGVDISLKNDYGNAAWDLTTDPEVRTALQDAARETHCWICNDEFNKYRFRHVCNYCQQVTCDKPECSKLKPPEEGSFECTRVCHACVERDREETARRQAEEAERERIAKLNASYTFTVKIAEAMKNSPSEEALGDLLASRNTGGGPVADFVIPQTVRPLLPPRPPGMWVHLRVYLSSTYDDCHAERKYLDEIVFPALRHFLRLRRVHIQLVDLRCDEDSELVYSDDYLEVALEAVDECQPFMLCVLGERYGWIPDTYEIPALPKFAGITSVEEGSRSTAEMEIKYGFLDRPQQSIPFFYLRDPKFMTAPKFKSLEDNVRQTFEETDDNARLKLKSLKDEVTQAVPSQQLFNDYPCEYDRMDNGVPLLSGLEEFGRRVFTDVWTALEVAYPKREVGEKHVVLRDLHEEHAQRCTRNFHGRSKLLAALLDYAAAAQVMYNNYAENAKAAAGGGPAAAAAAAANNGDDDGLDSKPVFEDEDVTAMLLVGDHGVGKSALIAEFARRHREANPNAFVFVHFVGVAPESDTVRGLILRLCQELSSHFSLGTTSSLLERQTLRQLRRSVKMLLTEASRKGPVVLAIDSLHKLSSSGLSRMTETGELVTWFREEIFDWIPDPLPAAVRLVISSGVSGPACEWLASRFFSFQVNVGPLEENDAKDIVRGACQAYEKDVDREQLGLLMRKQDSNKPLFLATVADILRRCRTVDEITRAIKDTPAQLDADKGLFVRILERLEAEHGADIVASALSGIYCAPEGYSDYDIIETANAILSAKAGVHGSTNIGAAGGEGAGGDSDPAAAIAGEQGDQGAGSGSLLSQAILAQIAFTLRELLHRPVASRGYTFRHLVFARTVRTRYLSDSTEQFHRRIASHYRNTCDPRGERTWTGIYDRGLINISKHLIEARMHADLQADMCDLRYLERRCAVQPVPAVIDWYKDMLCEPAFSEEVYVKLFQKFAQDWVSAPPKVTSEYSTQLRLLMDQLSVVVDEFCREAPYSLTLARLAVKELTDDDIRDLASQKKPPSSIQHIMEITLLCKGNKSVKWKSARSAISNPTFAQELCEVTANDLRDKPAAKAMKMLDHHAFSAWDVRLKSPAAAVFLQWSTAILHHYRKYQAHLDIERVNKYNFETIPDADRLEHSSAIDRAAAELRTVTKGDLNELRSQTRPPEIAKAVLAAVLILLGSEKAVTWQEARPKLGDSNFIPQLTSFDRDGVPREVLIRAEAIIDAGAGSPEFDPESAAGVSSALGHLASWVIAVSKYARLMLGAEKSNEKKRRKKKAAGKGKEKK